MTEKVGSGMIYAPIPERLGLVNLIGETIKNRLQKKVNEAKQAVYNDWEKLLEAYSIESISEKIFDAGTKLSNAQDIIIRGETDLRNNKKWHAYNDKRISSMQGNEVNFNKYEAWINWFYYELAKDSTNREIPQETRIGFLVEQLGELDNKKLKVFDHTKKVTILDFAFTKDPDEKSEVDELLHMARQYVLCNLVWIIGFEDYEIEREVYSHNIDQPVEKICDNLIAKISHLQISKRSLRDIESYLKSHISQSKARRYESEYLSDQLSLYTFIEDPKLLRYLDEIKKTRPEEFNYLTHTILLSTRLEELSLLADSFVSSEHVYTGMHPLSMKSGIIQRITELIKNNILNSPIELAKEEKQPFENFLRKVKPLIF